MFGKISATILFFYCAAHSFGQNRLALEVQSRLEAQIPFRPFAPLTAIDSPGEDVTHIVRNSTAATLNPEVVGDISKNRYEAIELSIPYNGNTLVVQLYRVEVTAENFHLNTDKASNVTYTPGAYYRGILKNDAHSTAAFSFFENELYGVVSGNGLNNLVVGKLRNSASGSYLIYSDADLLVPFDFNCLTADVETPAKPEYASNAGKSMHCVSLFFELQYTFYVSNSSDVTATTNWFTAMLNNVQTLYDNDGITTSLRTLHIWTEQDPYTLSGSSAYDLFNQFGEQRPAFDADAGQLVMYGGGNGLAKTVGGLCTDQNRSYSNSTVYYENVPTYSWTIEVVSHELGHTLGSQHTHGCYWNGNNTAIDGCGPAAGYVEGTCPQGPIPSASTGGTIMSYCHLLGSASSINFANGFGPQPAQRILDHIAASACLGTDCIHSCVNSVGAISLDDADATTATFSWEDELATQWEVGYAPYGNAITGWNTTAQTTVVLAGLSANTYYTFAVRPLCGSPLQTGAKNLIFSTGADWCAGATWSDVGGASGDYTEGLETVSIFKPGQNAEAVSLSFDQFFTQTSDKVYIYNGIGANAPLLATYSGYTPPGQSYQATNPPGALTVRFISAPQTVPTAGWVASVHCLSTLGLSESSSDDWTIYPNPATDVLTIVKSSSGNYAYSVLDPDGRLLQSGTADESVTTVDVHALPPGLYFLLLSNEKVSATIRKIVKE